MTTAVRHHRPLLVALVLAGLVLGHDVAFRLVAGGGAVRDHLLAETGHGDWNPTRLAAIVGMVVLVVAGAPARRHVHPTTLGDAYARVVARLTLLQAVGFLLLEGGERLGHGHGLLDLLHDPVLVVGTVVQLVVGLVGGALLVGACRLLASLHVPVPVRPTVRSPHRAPSRPRNVPAHHLLVADIGPRAPPTCA